MITSFKHGIYNSHLNLSGRGTKGPTGEPGSSVAGKKPVSTQAPGTKKPVPRDIPLSQVVQAGNGDLNAVFKRMRILSRQWVSGTLTSSDSWEIKTQLDKLRNQVGRIISDSRGDIDIFRDGTGDHSGVSSQGNSHQVAGLHPWTVPYSNTGESRGAKGGIIEFFK